MLRLPFLAVAALAVLAACSGDDGRLETDLTPPEGAPQGRIVFQSRTGEDDEELYVINTDGSGLVQLTEHPIISGDSFIDGDPTWSPDGERIAFTSDRDGDFEIYLMDAVVRQAMRLTDNMALDGNPAWSLDGERIVFVSDRDGPLDIYVMDEHGRDVIRLTQSPAVELGPAWSPDGTRIAFTTDIGVSTFGQEIFMMSADGSDRTVIAFDLFYVNFLAWSPDGTRFTFAALSADEGAFDIYVSGADGEDLLRLTDSADNDLFPTWSPDSEWIAFSSKRDGQQHEIYIMRADGSEQRRLTENAVRDIGARWSPVP